MQVTINAPGEVVISLIDRNGKTLVQQEILASGSPEIETKTSVDLVVSTLTGKVSLVPVLIRQGRGKQHVKFDKDEPAAFTGRRCQEIGCSPDITKKAKLGRASPLKQDVIRLPVSK